MITEDNAHKVIGLLKRGLKELYRIDYFNIRCDVSERNICARLAMHLENIMRKEHIFDGYFVDVEYNRQGGDHLKQYYDHVAQRPRAMVSDLLIQSRGQERNLLALELKKLKNKKDVDNDIKRLIELVKPDDSENRYCVHNTLVGAFVTYSSTEVSIQLFSEIEDINESTLPSKYTRTKVIIQFP